MKNLMLASALLILAAVSDQAVHARPVADNQKNAVVETSNVKTQGIRLFHAKRKLALHEVSPDGTKSVEPAQPAVRSLDFGTDNFIIN